MSWQPSSPGRSGSVSRPSSPQSPAPWVTKPLFGSSKWKEKSRKLIESVQPYVPEPIVNAAWFQPNGMTAQGGLGSLGLIIGVVTWVGREWAIRRRGGLAPWTLWVLTYCRVYVFDGRPGFKNRAILDRRIGAWDRSAIRVRGVRERYGALKGDPSFAMSLETSASWRVEVRAFHHGQSEFNLIQSLVSADDAAAALEIAKRLEYRAALRRRRNIWMGGLLVASIALFVFCLTLR